MEEMTTSTTKSLTRIILLSCLLHGSYSYDCYNQWCIGTDMLYGELFSCDQRNHHCEYTASSINCKSGYSGDGVICPCDVFECYDNPSDGQAACRCPELAPVMTNLMVGLVMTISIVSVIVGVVFSLRSVCMYFRRDQPSGTVDTVVISNPGHVVMGFDEPLDAPPSYFEVQLVTSCESVAPPSYLEAVREDVTVCSDTEHERST